ncbi:TonB-dependent receptor domain-containing protein [Pseudoduganella umbonata]|uniref:Iron complex outermembrane receptor protein n=1 Tax=Pseudoduganella umbonata TaxID=864828 RepID=A0A4P8HPE2_9BURK|nr:TonB-dependent receptor [Pseudoduganella umbonata]MBB3220954.1 iron complex outermembrane receptor protein [Pseudoduganella umbonata]QCP11597.1 TonB-dependent receptor [Pseudoduganella umbonata]
MKKRPALRDAAAVLAVMPTVLWAQAMEADAQAASDTGNTVTIVASRGIEVRPAITPSQTLSGAELVHRRQGGLGETLAGLPGVHLDSFGGGASRPVIRGQTLPRIEILSDGAALFDVSSVSPDHAVTTDPLLLDAIEIIRGPAAIRYGGNAVNGAINLIDSKVPTRLPAGGLSGATEVRYGTGDDEKTAVGRVTAGMGRLAIHAEGVRRHAGNYKVPGAHGTDKLPDSFAANTSYSVGASWITSKGYLGAAFTRMKSSYGLPGHSHLNGVCHTHDLDLHCTAHGGFDDPFGSPDSHTASIELRSDRFDVRADYADLLPGISHTRLRLSHTDYAHDEIDGAMLFTRYTNKVSDGRLELTHRPLLGFTGTLGAQYTDGTFSGINVEDLHVPFPDNAYGLVPPFHHLTRNVGLFLSERRSFGAVDLDFAVRKDWREMRVAAPTFLATMTPEYEAMFTEELGSDWRQILEADYVDDFFRKNPATRHNPVSASLGAIWNAGQGYSVGLSFGHTERAPNVRELYARGNNLSTNSYELGLAVNNPVFQQSRRPVEDVLESTDSIDLTLRKTGGPLEAEIGVFYQDVGDYIFARLIETERATGVAHNFLAYTAADVRFAGIDGQVSYQVTPASRITVSGDHVHARMKSGADHLPRIPRGRLGARYERSWGPLSADLEVSRTFGQGRIASYETETAGYNMVNATVAYRIDMGLPKPVEFYARGTNLTNELAYAHTSFVKNQSPLRGRSIAFGMRHVF